MRTMTYGMFIGNDRGRKLVKYLFTTYLNIVNSGPMLAFVNRRRLTITDLTLTTEEVAKHISN